MNGPLNVRRYLQRIGYDGPQAPSLALLQAINRLHAGAIAFENLDVLLGQPQLRQVPEIFDKLVMQNRGGICFEHNQLLQEMLTALGFTVRTLAARVLWMTPDDAQPPAQTHILLQVDLAEGIYLVDIAFGGLTLIAPIEFSLNRVQTQGPEAVRVVANGPEFDLQVELSSQWKTLHRFSTASIDHDAIEAMRNFAWTDPTSLFTRNLICARVDEEGRYNLLNHRLTTRHPHEEPQVRKLTTGQDLADVLKGSFLIDPPAGVLGLWG